MVIKFVIFVTLAYFIGNISPSIILGKLAGVDIKKKEAVTQEQQMHLEY